MNSLLLARKEEGPAISPIYPDRELGACEALWLESKATFKTIADPFKADPAAMPSDFVEPSISQNAANEVFNRIRQRVIKRFGIRINQAGDYPRKLRYARHPVEVHPN